MNLTGIYAITDDALLPEARLYAAVTDALESGVSLLQFRNKSGSDESRLQQAQKLLALCENYQTPLIINDDVELCRQLGAHGVHLGQSDAGVDAARQRLGSDAIIGVTCHSSIEHAQQAEDSGASYVAFGRFYNSSTKPEAPPADAEILTSARTTLSIPIVAIGGINADNGAALIDAGADMLAVINGIFGSDDVTANTRRLVSLFNE